MRRIVVDSSVVIKWFVPEPISARARAILIDYQAGRLALIAPDTILTEIAARLWQKHVRHKLSLGDGYLILSAFRALGLTLFPAMDVIDEAYRLAVKSQSSVYGMVFVALAQREGCDYVTADEEFAIASSPLYERVVALSAWK